MCTAKGWNEFKIYYSLFMGIHTVVLVPLTVSCHCLPSSFLKLSFVDWKWNFFSVLKKDNLKQEKSMKVRMLLTVKC